MSISPPPLSPPRAEFSEEDDNDYVDDDDQIDNARTITSSFDLYKNAIDRLRSSIACASIEQQQESLEHFKPLSTRTNAWLYMRMHDDLFTILLDYLLIDNLPLQSTALSIFANIACDQTSHEQLLDTDLIDIVCRKVIDIDHIDVANRCFRLLGNVCTVEDAARKMIDADLSRAMGDVLRTCTDAACLHSTIRCSRKLSTYAFCRERMLDSMCLLSICKQLFAEKIPLRKEAMKAVLEWDIDSSDRSRAQLREGEIFRFLILTIESKTDKEYRHIAFRLLNNLLRHSDMRTEFGVRQGLDFFLGMINNQQYQSTYEHLKFIGLFCVCCQEANNRRLIKDDMNKLQLFFHYLEKYQYRSNFLDLLLTAIGQFIYDDQSLSIFVKQMQFIEKIGNVLETAVMVKYESNEKRPVPDDECESSARKRMKTKHTTDHQQPRMSITLDFNETLFTEFVENTHLDEERPTSPLLNHRPATNTNIEIRRRTEALIFTLLSKLSYTTTDKALRQHLYDRRLVSLLLRYIASCDEPNPRAVRILHRLTKTTDCSEHLLTLGLPHAIAESFYPTTHAVHESHASISADDQYLLNILLNDNRAFFQRLSWTNERNRLKTIEHTLLRNIESSINTPYAINELVRRLNDENADEKFHLVLTFVATLKEQHFQSMLFEKCSGYDCLVDHSDQGACFWALRTLSHRCVFPPHTNHLTDFLRRLNDLSQVPPVTETSNVELHLNNKELITVNRHLFSAHSDYFKSLFTGAFVERHQTRISLQLPETVSIESFRHVNDILTTADVSIRLHLVPDLFDLCDRYLFDHVPFRVAHFVLEQFLDGKMVDLVEMISKPKLISSLVRAFFCHLLLANDATNSLERFLRLISTYSAELRTVIRSFVQHQCWFDDPQSFP